MTPLEEEQHEMLEVKFVAPDHEVNPGRQGESCIDDSTAQFSKIKSRPNHGLVYSIEDMPPWHTTILLGLQVRQQAYPKTVTTAQNFPG